jgi:two-component system, chemotaxis family, CheB/CheR fusion protein
MPEQNNHGLSRLLNYIKQNRGFDFTGYKSASLERRIQKRLRTLAIPGYTDYIDHLEVHPDEFADLFNTILINVTGFFRDPPAWKFLEEQVIPRILAEKKPEDMIRVWSTGCASGEETYSIAILLAEALGEDQFLPRVKIFGTDVDDEALAVARQASYSTKEVEGLPTHLLKKYFSHEGKKYTFRKELRRNLVFGINDIAQDAPISRLDLIICRNTLMYFNAEAQNKIVMRFHFGLNEKGFLFLGKAETLITHSNAFTPVELKHRIFAKNPTSNPLLQQAVLLRSVEGEKEVQDEWMGDLSRRVFETSPVAMIVIGTNQQLMMVNEQARLLLNLSLSDVGRPFQDLEISYRPIELRSHIEQAYKERSPIIIRDVKWSRIQSDSRFYDFRLMPLILNAANFSGISLSFIEVTKHKLLQNELERLNNALETAMEELQSTNEELETTNEELQSTIEELETTNEELQSTNEELETMNEELQSTNQEMHTINNELNLRTQELNLINTLMESILTSIRLGVVVLDPDLRVLVWNRRSEIMWGLPEDEVQSRNFLNLEIGLPVEQLKKPLLSCLAGEKDVAEVTLEATNRFGQRMFYKVTCNPLIAENSKVKGAIIWMEEESVVE